MPKTSCPSCKTESDTNFRFCPYCGFDLKKPITCPNCNYSNEYNSKFCQECGTPFVVKNISTTPTERKVFTEPKISILIEAPPISGITIEFPFSTAQSFDFAVVEAKKFSGFKQYGTEKKAIYRITIQPHEIELTSELLEHLKGWRKRTVYVNGEKVPWDTVFSFTWCYEKKKSSFKSEYYCFGYENEYQFNTWGCIQANLPFTEFSPMFSWGSWLNNKGDWKFDKERIRFELQKTLFRYQYCPAMRPDLIQDVLNALPNVVNPIKDKNWKFVESWGNENVPGIVVTVNRYGIKENVVMKGVTPNGHGALKEMKKKMKYSLPIG